MAHAPSHAPSHALPHDTQTFLSARRAFESVFLDVAKAKRNWQVVAFTALALLGLVTIAYVRLATTSRLVPYIVEVDQLGRAASFGPAAPLQRTDRRIIIAQLATFLRNVRTVVPSDPAQRDLIRRAYAFVDPQGAAFLNAYFSLPANDPRVLATRMTRTVEVSSLLPVPPSTPSAPTSTWKVQWTETEFPTLAGGLTRTAAWEGYLTVRVIPPAQADVIEDNPLGLYVTAITWTQITGALAVPDSSPTLPAHALSLSSGGSFVP
jgi:type IV secretion system protein VirB5